MESSDEIKIIEKTEVTSEEILRIIRDGGEISREILKISDERLKISGDFIIKKEVTEEEKSQGLIPIPEIKKGIIIKDSDITGKFAIKGVDSDNKIKFFANIHFENVTFFEQVIIQNCEIGSQNQQIDPSFSFINCKFKKGISINHAGFSHFWLYDSEVEKDSRLDHVKFQKTANFHRTEFKMQIHVMHCRFAEYTYFDGVQFGDVAFFSGDKFLYKASFSESYDDINTKKTCKFFNRAIFQRVIFRRELSFDKAEFTKGLELIESEFNGPFSLKETIINNDTDPRNAHRHREIVFRSAKKAAEKHGFYVDAADHYFNEMVAIRHQKDRCIDILEWIFIERFLGYGVRIENIFYTWLGCVVAFTFLTWHYQGIVDIQNTNYFFNCFLFSLMKVSLPAFSAFDVNLSYKILEFTEAIIGTYLWAGIIASIGKKFLKI
jgi:hypothetical protein